MRHIVGLLLFLSVTLGQVNDKNFKEKVNGGMVVVVVTAEWQEQPFDKDILKGVSTMVLRKKLGRQIWMESWILIIKT